MNDKVFLDTNILIYLYSVDEPTKQAKVKKIFSKHQDIFISTQILSELSNVLYKKKLASFEKIARVIEEISKACFIEIIGIDTILYALSIAKKYKYSYYDSLVVAKTLESGSTILYTEDMHSGHCIENKVKIINPFV